MLGFFKSKEWKLLWPFYVKIFLFGLFSIMGAFGIIYLQSLNLSYAKIGQLTAIAAISIIIFELPTGAFADLYGRRLSTITGLMIIGLCNIGITFAESFASLAILFLLVGLGASFMSGAYTAWVVDYLRHEKQEKLIQPLMVKFSSFASAGAILGPLLGSLLAKNIPLKYLWSIQGAGMIAATLILVFFTKEYFEKSKNTKKSKLKESWENTKEAIKISLTHRTLLLMLLAGIFTIIFMSTGMGWQPLLTSLKMPTYSLGYFYSIIAALGVFMPYLAKYITKAVKREKDVFAIEIAISLVLTLLIYFAQPPMFYVVCIILAVNSAISDAVFPIASTFTQKVTPAKHRATITSFQTMVLALTMTIATLIAGKVMDSIGPKGTILLFTVFLIPSIVFYLMVKE